MFPSGPSDGGGGLERSHPSRRAAHPYLDSVSPPTGLPMSSSYSGRLNLESDNAADDRSNAAAADRDDNDDSSGARFGEEDRMLLRLLYHQQQAIQVQLNTMTEWMQQVNYRIATVERLMRTSRSTASTAAPSGGRAAAAGLRSYSAQPPSLGSPAMDSYAPMSNLHLISQSRPISSSEQASAEAPRGHPPGQGSTHSGQSHPASSVPAVSSVLESSRACTPPSEQTRHHIGGGGAAGSSAVPSTTRSYESALAAPWDPHNTSQQSLGAAGHSRTSSHTSALGRRANPLLNSSGVRSKAPLPAAVSRSSLADSRHQLSRLDISGMSGTGGQTSPTSIAGATSEAAPAQPAPPRQPPVVSPPATSSLTAADAVAAVPPYRRVPAEPTIAMALTRQPLSRVSAVTRHAPPTSTLADAADSRNGREATLPPPQRSAATSSLQDDTQNRSTAAEQGARERTKEAASAASAGFPSAHVDPMDSRGGGNGPFRSGAESKRHVVADDDSLSDGYGSYESRMYMKNLGLL
ncbi:hypothetical protein ABL78_2702 [Leptomonas seymouri]|uniref:Uncharacterized protein n=1 Tax=Leptomonas seymouri TaxID=5684 RepID=A0A0N1PCL9_LEPSE|nr:hypothetical protein ABL78_2702 [Leptomonas seymouri]|eukprot:KPI88198.1 hypothetical protein ABL78_2702 [Leptomonas seymouri]